MYKQPWRRQHEGFPSLLHLGIDFPYYAFNKYGPKETIQAKETIPNGRHSTEDSGLRLPCF